MQQCISGTNCQTALTCTFKKEGSCRQEGGALFHLNMQQLQHRGSIQMFSPRRKSPGPGAWSFFIRSGIQLRRLPPPHAGVSRLRRRCTPLTWTCTFWTTGCGSPASPRAAFCTSHTRSSSYCSCGTGHGRDPLHPAWGLIVACFSRAFPASVPLSGSLLK